MPDAVFQNLFLIRQEAFVGGVLIVFAVAPGWWLGRDRGHLLVRTMAWWIDHVVHPLLVTRSWLRRTTTIAVNNATVCASMVLLGPFGYVAWVGVAGVGLGLGIALRLMIGSYLPGMDDRESPPAARHPIRETLGLALNLLEVPAIMIAAGASLAQGALSSTLSLTGALAVFVVIVLPLLIVSAAGEALWMSVSPELPPPDSRS